MMACCYRNFALSWNNFRPKAIIYMKTGTYVWNPCILWKNRLLFTTSQVSSSCCTYSSVISHRTLCYWKVHKYSLGGCTVWTSSSQYFSTDGSKITKPENKNNEDGVNQIELQETKERLAKLVSSLFSGQHDYGILHKNVVLENNLFGKDKTRRGLLSYAVELLKVRLRIHAHFSGVFVEIRDIRFLEKDNIIRIQWCLKAVSQTNMLRVMKHFKSMSTFAKEDYDFLEAYSYFHVDKDGLILKHRIDRKKETTEREVDQLKH